MAGNNGKSGGKNGSSIELRITIKDGDADIELHTQDDRKPYKTDLEEDDLVVENMPSRPQLPKISRRLKAALQMVGWAVGLWLKGPSGGGPDTLGGEG